MRLVPSFTIFISFLTFSASGFEFTADNSFLLQCPIRKSADFEYLRGLQEQGHHIDIFEEKVPVDGETLVHLLTTLETSELLLSRAGCFEEKSHSTVRRLFALNPAATATTLDQPIIGPAFHNDYRSYQNILSQLNYYASVHPETVKAVKTIGKSHEGRDLVVIHITAAKNKLGEKPVVWVMAGQHAREWIGISSSLFFIDQLLHPTVDPAILDNFEFAVMPLVNPDGYEYSRTRNKLWRKNRRGIRGVDLNRNWDHRWCEIGGSMDPKMENYCGPGPASEPEIHYTQNYILSLPTRFMGFDIHSYSQLILRNYGWTRDPCPHERSLADISNLMAQRIYQVTGLRYTPQRSANMQPSSGSSDDWLYVKAGIPGFILEMRDTGRFGFNLPPGHIRPAGLELYAAIITAITNYK